MVGGRRGTKTPQSHSSLGEETKMNSEEGVFDFHRKEK